MAQILALMTMIVLLMEKTDFGLLKVLKMIVQQIYTQEMQAKNISLKILADI